MKYTNETTKKYRNPFKYSSLKETRKNCFNKIHKRNYKEDKRVERTRFVSIKSILNSSQMEMID